MLLVVTEESDDDEHDECTVDNDISHCDEHSTTRLSNAS